MTTTIACVDVGQGDCTVIVDHTTDSAIIIDCRLDHDDDALRELGTLRAQTISAVIASHTHNDHLFGLPPLVNALERSGYLASATPFHVNVDTLSGNDELKRVFRDLGKKDQDGVLHLLPAEEDWTGGTGQTTWTIVAPCHGQVVLASGGDRNLASAIVLLNVKDWSGAMVIGGDAPLKSWHAAANRIPRGAHVRWPHHGGGIGGGSASQVALYDLLDPEVVIVSVGESNTRPSLAFREAAADHPSPTYCTGAGRGCPSTAPSCRGTIRVVVDNGAAEIKSDHPSPGPGCC